MVHIEDIPKDIVEMVKELQFALDSIQLSKMFQYNLFY